jgi:glycerol-3-phosphate cytidylyltransferase-like family protein
MFKECKNHCTHLTVALHDNPAIERNKAKPVHTLEERKEILSSIKYIDDIVFYSYEDELEKILNKFDKRFLGDDYLNKDYTGSNLDMPVVYINRTHNYSTGKLKEMIYRSHGV